MGRDSKINWTDHTFNPWWGCSKVSLGCANCYAESLSTRYGHSIWGATASRRFFGDKHWNEPLSWNRAAAQSGQTARVFCASMADVYEDRPDLVEPRERLFELIHATPALRWLLVTKRPENILRMGYPETAWLGVSAENQTEWNRRVSVLLTIPASVRFVSAEPLLDSIDMGNLSPDWLIVGGESGPKARPVDPAWVRSLRDQCLGRVTKFWFKQWGGVRPDEAGRELDGREWSECPE